MGNVSINIGDFKGLYNQPNSFSLVPPGALEVAQNVVFTQDGVMRKARGFAELDMSVSALPVSAKTLFPYGTTYLYIICPTKLIKLDPSTGSTDNVIPSALDGGAFSASTAYTPHAAQISGNAYITGETRIWKLETTTDVLTAGIPPGLDAAITLSTNAGILGPDKIVGYRVVFGRTDANENKVVGAPSQLTTITNPLTAATWAQTASTSIVVTSTAHGLSVNDLVTISEAATAYVNGEDFVVTAVTTNTFTYTCSTSGTTSGSLEWGVYRKPTLSVTVPSRIATSTSFFYQIYRTSQVATSVGSVSDDGQLVYEAATPGTSSITFVDEVNEIFRGADLYTNPYQSGIQSAAFEPPVAKDVAVFRDCLFLGNIEGRQSKVISLITTLSSSFAGGNTITIDGIVYEATTSAPASEGGSAASTPNTSTTWEYGGTSAGSRSYFRLKAPSGSVSVSTSIEDTAKSLCRAINRRSSGTVYALYISGPDDSPGQIRLLYKTGSTAFNITGSFASSSPAAFSPDLNGVTVASEPDVAAGSVAFSKTQEPEAFPLANRLLIGNSSSAVLRLIPLQDSLIILKQGDGVWKVTGDGPSNFSVTQIDATLNCVAANSAVALNNQVFFLSNQGIVALTEQGAQVVSRQIENIIQPILGNTNLAASTFAVAYESERQYRLTTLLPGGTEAEVVYIFNIVTQTWSTSTEQFVCGVVAPSSDKLCLMTSDDEFLRERKTFDALDYTGRSYSATADSIVSTTQFQLNITGAPSIAVGDCFVKTGSITINKVLSVDTATTPYPTVTCLDVHGLSAADTGTFYKSIPSVARTAPQALGDVNKAKHFSEFKVTMRSGLTSKMTFSFRCDNQLASESTTWTTQYTGNGWGFNWGAAWGGASTTSIFETQGSETIRTYVPLNQSRGTFIQAEIQHSVAGEDLIMQAFGFTGRIINSTKTVR